MEGCLEEPERVPVSKEQKELNGDFEGDRGRKEQERAGEED